MTGIECSMPLRMFSSVCLVKTSDSVVETVLVILPVYCIEIFSYHRALPCASRRLKG